MHEIGGLVGQPVEILLNVFKYLDGRDLARCMRVSKTWKYYIDESSATQYAIRLTKHGYKDSPRAQDGPYSSTASRLKAFEDHIKRWGSLDWIEERIRLPEKSLPWKELAGGILAFSHCKSITCIKLPSRICQSPLRTWTHKSDFEILSFTIDPSQDLLVLVEILDSNGKISLDMHLRTLSGNTQHPRASGILSSQDLLDIDNMRNKFYLRVMGDAVALLGKDARLLIWNWLTGELICDLEASGFVWIGPRTILLPWNSHDTSVCGALELYEVGQATRLRKTVVLELPLYYSPKRLGFFLYDVHANPTPSGCVPFDSSDLWNIHVSICALDYDPAENSPDLVVSVAMLEQYAHEYLHRDHVESTPSISWTDWGPHNTCLIHRFARDHPRWCETRGSRFAWLDTSKNLSVVDFTPNLIAVRPDLSQSQSPTLGSVGKTESNDRSASVIESYESPVHPKGTGRPYHEVKRKLAPPLSEPSHIFVDEEHILLFAADEPVLIVLTL
ncbi:hypothetical protein BS47DRAFT_1489590 [Hydnum rufescens UP504]|uniref:F-box domain-containing protein n=1 Tax=Hydnum rufescens UP504 TaxID=1448309 RepID=A0A9P6DLK4_9AGAM|nr:hypothetical protein BS47DRAFT_1489590 [Hydnum rufescens UP504]